MNVSSNPPVDGAILVEVLEVAMVSAVEVAPAGGLWDLVAIAVGTILGAEEAAVVGVFDG